MLRALKPGGGVAVTVPQHPSLWSYQDELACHVRRYRRDELRQKFGQAGFRVEYETSFVSLLLPAMYVSRLTKKAGQEDRDPTADLRVPTFINRLFEAVMGVERQLIRLGIRLPVGGSRLLIARKPG